jgi:hypothetical protein
MPIVSSKFFEACLDGPFPTMQGPHENHARQWVNTIEAPVMTKYGYYRIFSSPEGKKGIIIVDAKDKVVLIIFGGAGGFTNFTDDEIYAIFDVEGMQIKKRIVTSEMFFKLYTLAKHEQISEGVYEGIVALKTADKVPDCNKGTQCLKSFYSAMWDEKLATRAMTDALYAKFTQPAVGAKLFGLLESLFLNPDGSEIAEGVNFNSVELFIEEVNPFDNIWAAKMPFHTELKTKKTRVDGMWVDVKDAEGKPIKEMIIGAFEHCKDADFFPVACQKILHAHGKCRLGAIFTELVNFKKAHPAGFFNLIGHATFNVKDDYACMHRACFDLRVAYMGPQSAHPNFEKEKQRAVEFLASDKCDVPKEDAQEAFKAFVADVARRFPQAKLEADIDDIELELGKLENWARVVNADLIYDRHLKRARV